MKIEFEDGQPVIDARDLGGLLEIAPAQVQAMMRSGEITSKYETGEGEDAGRFRLTFYHNGRRVRLTCGEDGKVISTIRTSSGPR